MIKRLILVGCIFIETNIYAGVQVVRTTGEDVHQVKLKELPEERIAKEAKRPVKLSGNLRLGYQMTKDTQGAQDSTINSLSSLAINTIFGLRSDISVNRQNLTNGDTEEITLGASIQKTRYSISFNTTNSEKNTIVSDKLNKDKGNSLSLSLGLSMIEGLPISIGYSRSKNKSQSAPGTITQNSESQNLSFNLQGSFLKQIGWGLGLSQAKTKDILNDKKTNNLGISGNFSLPITKNISMSTGVSTNRTKNYLSQDTYTKISQEGCNSRLNFRVSERLNTNLGVSYNRSKSEETTSSSIGNDFNLSYRLSEKTNISYSFNQTKSGDMCAKSNLISTIYTPKGAKITNVSLSYGLSSSKSPTGETKHHNLNINSSAKLTNQLSLTQGIGMSKESDKHTQQITTGLGYNRGKLNMGINLAQNTSKDAGKQTAYSQSLQTNLGYPVNILNKTLPISLNYGYTLGIERIKSDSFGLSSSFPLTEQINFGYAYSRSNSKQVCSQNNTFNLSLRGKKKAYALNTTISLLKADKLTRNLVISLSYPLLERLSLEMGSHYTKQEGVNPTYNISAGLGYSF